MTEGDADRGSPWLRCIPLVRPVEEQDRYDGQDADDQDCCQARC